MVQFLMLHYFFCIFGIAILHYKPVEIVEGGLQGLQPHHLPPSHKIFPKVDNDSEKQKVARKV